jgi:hypothetical protein
MDEEDWEQRAMMTELMKDARNLYTGGPESEVEDKKLNGWERKLEYGQDYS